MRLNGQVNAVSDLLQCIFSTEYFQSAALYLQISELTESLATAREPTHEGFDLVMNTLVCLQIAQLSKRLVTSGMWALIRSFPSVFALMGLDVARKGRSREYRGTINSLPIFQSNQDGPILTFRFPSCVKDRSHPSNRQTCDINHT